MKSKIIASTLVMFGFILGASALSVLADWTAPTQAPPGCPAGSPGCDAPLHVGAGLQTKLGQLSLNADASGAYGLEVLNGIKLLDTSVLGGTAAGKVLTSDANGVGTWQSIPTISAASGMTSYTTPGTYNFAVPAGARFAKITAAGAPYCNHRSGQSAAPICDSFGGGGMAIKVFSLSGSNSVSVTITGGVSTVTVGGQTIVAGTRGDIGQGGDFNGISPVASPFSLVASGGAGGYDMANGRNGFVIIEYY